VQLKNGPSQRLPLPYSRSARQRAGPSKNDFAVNDFAKPPSTLIETTLHDALSNFAVYTPIFSGILHGACPKKFPVPRFARESKNKLSA
jgi:hypothetical protein